MGTSFISPDWEKLSRFLPHNADIIRVTPHTFRMMTSSCSGGPYIDQETDRKRIAQGILGYVWGRTIMAAPDEADHFVVYFQRGQGAFAEYLGSVKPDVDDFTVERTPDWFTQETTAAKDTSDCVKVCMFAFDDALRLLKRGKKVARHGWNGQGMYVTLQPGYPDGIAINLSTARATGLTEGTVCRFRPYLMLRTAQQDFVPWAPTVSDVLAEDWTDVE